MKKFLSRLKNRGQTAVEYLLLMLVAVALIFGMGKSIMKFFVDDPNSFVNRFTKLETYGVTMDYKLFSVKR